MDEIMLKVENVSKQYILGQIGGTTLRDELQRWNAKVRGKEDPTRMIGAKEYQAGETFMALDGVSFEVKKGERVGIIGHNGAGKSTLLKLISRITAPTGGTIGLNGRVASMLEVGTGFHAELTGRENIYMNGAILGMTKKEIDAKIEDIIEFSECRQFIDTPVKRYSSGMYVKLAFSVAAHLDSEIMIMDEVLAVGDMSFQKKCLDKMNDVSKTEGKTILYVSHNMNTIRQLCERCLVLNKGRIVFDGDVDKAVDIYMKGSIRPGVSLTFNDERDRSYKLDGSLQIKRVDQLNKETPVYQVGEHIKLKIYYRAKEDCANFCCRSTVFSDQGSIVGMASTGPSIDSIKGTNEIILEMEFTNLAPGNYYAKIVFFSIDGYGNTKNLEVVDNAFSFEIIPKTDSNNFVWQRKYWGDIYFPEIKVIKGN